jgi:hypothetical protein
VLRVYVPSATDGHREGSTLGRAAASVQQLSLLDLGDCGKPDLKQFRSANFERTMPIVSR